MRRRCGKQQQWCIPGRGRSGRQRHWCIPRFCSSVSFDFAAYHGIAPSCFMLPRLASDRSPLLTRNVHAAGESGAPMSTTPMASQDGSPQGPLAGSGSGEGHWAGTKGRERPSAPEGSLTAKVWLCWLIPQQPGRRFLHTILSAGLVHLQQAAVPVQDLALPLAHSTLHLRVWPASYPQRKEDSQYAKSEGMQDQQGPPSKLPMAVAGMPNATRAGLPGDCAAHGPASCRHI